MKIICPTCKKAVPIAQINMSTDLAFCPICDDAFKISETVDSEYINDEAVKSPPGGAWFRRELRGYLVGASTRSYIAFFLVPFMAVWSGLSLSGLYGTQLSEGKFDLFRTLFGLPFLMGSVVMFVIALMSIWGKIEFEINENEQSSVFIGVGSIGWKRYFDWKKIHTVKEESSNVKYPGSGQTKIILEGTRKIAVGYGVSEERKYFLVNSLKYLISKRTRQKLTGAL